MNVKERITPIYILKLEALLRRLPKDAHYSALNDYLLLICPTISNKQFREFANIDSSSTSSKLLRSTGLPATGTTKDTRYQLSYLPNSEENS